MKEFVLDIEADGYLSTVTRITVAHIRSVETNKGKLFKDGYELTKYVKKILDKGYIIICHNVAYDIGVLYKLYDFNMFKYFKQFRDTLLTSQLLFPKKLLYKKFKEVSHSLATMSKIVGKIQKQEYTGRYDEWSKELQNYLLYDTASTRDLYLWLKDQKPYPSKITRQLEIFNTLIAVYYQVHGWKIDTKLFKEQYQSFIAKRTMLDMKLANKFLPLWSIDKGRKIRPHIERIEVPISYKNLLDIPKVSFSYKKLSKRITKKFIKTLREEPYRVIKVKHYTPYTNIKLEYFKPNSRQSVVKFMKQRFNTKFIVLSKTNNYKLDKEVFSQLIKSSVILQEKEILKLLAERFTTSKIISEYESINKLMVDGRIYANCKVLGASNSNRMSMNSPNLQQLSNKSPIRSCFTVDTEYSMLDTDLSSAELMLQANALYPYDRGNFGKVLLEGDKHKGTDFHSLNSKALKVSRNEAKAIFYGISYQMGMVLLGFTMWDDKVINRIDNYYSPEEIDQEYNKLKRRTEKVGNILYYSIKEDYKIPFTRKVAYMSLYGLLLKTDIQKNIKGLDELLKELDKQVKETKGYVYALERLMYAKEANSKLNYILQPNNAIYTKYWVLYSMSIAFKLGFTVPNDFLPLAVIHDQLVWQVKTKHILVFKKIVDKATTLINRKFNLKFGIECDTEIVKNLTGH